MKLPWRLTLATIAWFAFTASDSLAGPGEWDRTYAPVVVGSGVYATAIQSNDMLVIGGSFTSVDGSSSHQNIARLYPDGSLDSTFSVGSQGFSGTVWSLAVESNGSILIGGSFSYINGSYRYNVARLNSNGTVDGSFVPTNAITGSVFALAVQTNNAVLIGGTFDTLNFPDFFARLNADGTTDSTLSTIVNGPVYAIAIQPDGGIIIGGAFNMVNGVNRYRIARLHSDGSLDTTFQNGLSGASSNVRCIQIQSNGEVLIGGDFNTVNGVSRGYVARLTSTGALDTGFAANGGANASVYSLAVQSDGEVLVGGLFSSYASGSGSRVARLYDDGTRDTTFTNFGINNNVEALAIQSDGGIIIGGTFTTVNNTNWSCLARLYGDLYPPEFVTEPASVNTNVGANVTFSAQMSNPTATSFQWLKDGVDIPGATDTSYTLFDVQTADSGTYSVFVTDAIGGTTSSNAVLQVGIAPVITSQPVSLTVTQGQYAAFTVAASGTPLYYFWYDNGEVMPGQTNSTLAFDGVYPVNAGTYTCLVSNFLGKVTSTGAVLTVMYPPLITVQPVSQAIDVGSNFTVSVTAAGDPAIACQWRTNGVPIPGATATNYSVAAAQISNSGEYDVVITNSFGSITSSVANISVGFPPVVLQQPSSLTNALGGAAGFSCVVTGSAPLNLQWTLNGNPILNATNSNLTITNLVPGNIGFYALTATNAFGAAVSSNAALNLVGYAFDIWNGLVAYYPFDGNAIDATGNGNNGTVLGATLAADRFGQTNSAYSFDGVSSEIDVPDTSGFDQNAHTISVWLNAANLSPMNRVRSDIIGKDASQQWTLQLEQSGQLFNSIATTAGAYAFDSMGAIASDAWVQVILVWDGVTNSTYINGSFDSGTATSGSLVQGTDPVKMGGDQSLGQFFQGELDDIRIYDLALSPGEVTNLFVIEADIPIITRQPQPQMVDLGGTANFSVTATAVHSLSYQWQLNGAPVAGATNAVLTITNVQPASLGSYSVTVSNNFIGVVSSAAALAAQPTLTLLSSSSQSLNLNVLGMPQSSYVLQFATNLAPPINWQPILTNQTDTNGLWQFSDTNLNFPQKYYRVTSP